MTDDQCLTAGARLDQAIANAVVRQHSRCVGRGPTKAQTFHRRDIVVVMLQGLLSHGERSLVRLGRGESVRRLRMELQETMRDDLARQVEELTGSKVLALLNDHQLEADVAVQLFVLDRPVPGGADDAGGEAGAADPRASE